MGVVWMNAKSACLKRETKQIIGGGGTLKGFLNT